MILTPTQRRTMERGIATANEVLPRLDFLQQLSEIDQGLKQRHDDLRTKRDFLHKLSTKAVELDRNS